MHVLSLSSRLIRLRPLWHAAMRISGLWWCLCWSLAWTGAAQAQGTSPSPQKTAQQAQAKVKAQAKNRTPTRPKNKAEKKGQKPGGKNTQASAPSGTRLAANPEVTLWAQDAAARLQIDADGLQKTMASAQRLPLVEKLVLPPASPAAKDWGAYRARFIEPIRIQAGRRFWLKHQASLERAEREYGVPASIIVGIIGVETLYGQNTGNFRVLDALGTLAFHFPAAHPRAAQRQAFFRNELEAFLRLTSQSGADPLLVRGSYAGAMGLPQFMPSSWAQFAVDFDGDGRIDLFGSPADAIGSVANYFKAFQWRPGLPTHYPVVLTPGTTDMDSLLAPDILPTFSVANFVAQGAALEAGALTHPGPLALIELRNGPNAPSYVAGTENFYAITRYNWSSYYAMAVIELAEAVAREMPIKR
jgi:membrane-bound lytic murein transglycosylase B